MTAKTAARKTAAQSAVADMIDKAHADAAMRQARHAVKTGTATPRQAEAVADAESMRAGAKARQREDARAFLAAHADNLRNGVPTPDRESYRKALAAAEAIVAEHDARRNVIDAAQDGRMTLDALQALAFGAAIRSVGAARRRGWKIGRDRLQTVTADLAANLTTAVLESTHDARHAERLGRAWLAAPNGDAATLRAIVHALDTPNLPAWTDTPRRDDGSDYEGTPRERWTAHLLVLASREVYALRRDDEHGAMRAKAQDAATAAQDAAERLPHLLAAIDAVDASLAAPLSSAERRAILAATDGRTAAERAADNGTTAGAERVAATAGRKALAKRYPTPDALAVGAEQVRDALNALAAERDATLSADVLKRAGWTPKRVALNVATGKAHAASAAVAQLAERAERRLTRTNAHRAAVQAERDATPHGRPEDVLRFIDYVDARADDTDPYGDALAHRAMVRAILAPPIVPVTPGPHDYVSATPEHRAPDVTDAAPRVPWPTVRNGRVVETGELWRRPATRTEVLASTPQTARSLPVRPRRAVPASRPLALVGGVPA